MKNSPFGFVVTVVTVLSLVVLCPTSFAETFQVDRFDDANGSCDPGDCSLREALLAAEATPEADTVILPPGRHTLSISGMTPDSLDEGDLEVLNFDVTITAPDGATVDGQGIDTVFRFLNSSSRIENLTITGGSRPTGLGGGIFSESSALELSGVWLVDNEAYRGGGLAMQLGTVVLRESAVSGNRSETSGGGIYVFGISATRPGRIEIINSTVSGNEAPQSGAGIQVASGGQLDLEYATVIDNSPVPGTTGIFPDLYPLLSLSDVRYSLVEGTCDGGADVPCIYLASENAEIPVAELGLEPLALNGGRTPTHALQDTSPAVDIVPAGAECPPTDQRGEARPRDGNRDASSLCDAGAFELASNLPEVPSVSAAGRLLFGVLVTFIALGLLRR